MTGRESERFDMVQPSLNFGVPPRDTLTDKMARHFRWTPNVWVDVMELAQIGGIGGWRTRVSECRRDRGMKIEQRLIHWPDGRNRSQYCYRPAGQREKVA